MASKEPTYIVIVTPNGRATKELDQREDATCKNQIQRAVEGEVYLLDLPLKYEVYANKNGESLHLPVSRFPLYPLGFTPTNRVFGNIVIVGHLNGGLNEFEANKLVRMINSLK
jgi:hypothetical protein